MKFEWKGWLAAALLVAVSIGAATMLVAPRQAAVADADMDRAEIEAIVREYILANPEIIPEAITVLQQRQRSGTIEQMRSDLETPFAGAWAGANDADVVMVEFFDYNCPYCRRSNADVQRLLKEDPKLKVVWREMPVLGAPSRKAAEVSLAAAKVGRFREYHDAMFDDARRVGDGKIEDIAGDAGLPARIVDGASDAPDIRVEIDRNLAMARQLGVTGTPAYVIGDQMIDGAAGYEALKAAVAEARSAR